MPGYVPIRGGHGRRPATSTEPEVNHYVAGMLARARISTTVPPALGGHLGLAFVNTVYWRRGPGTRDIVDGYPALIGYLHRTGLTGQDEHEALLAAGAAHPRAARAMLTRALELREAMYRVLSADVADDAAPKDDVTLLNAVLTDGLHHVELRPDARTLAWRVGGVVPHWPLWAIAAATADLLTAGTVSGRRPYKQCPGQRCGWLFIDFTRNQNRRWCEDHLCGNRSRAREHYRRTRAGHPADS
jgi:predicted RNA-binding Zn ribbon-like protein